MWSAEGIGELSGSASIVDNLAILWVDSGLSAGSYEVKLLVADEGAESTEKTVSFTVVQNLPPLVTFLSPANGSEYAEGKLVLLTAHVVDSDAASNEELVLSWTGSPIVDAAPTFPDAAGNASLSLADLAIGNYDISVAVTNYSRSKAAKRPMATRRRATIATMPTRNIFRTPTNRIVPTRRTTTAMGQAATPMPTATVLPRAKTVMIATRPFRRPQSSRVMALTTIATARLMEGRRVTPRLGTTTPTLMGTASERRPSVANSPRTTLVVRETATIPLGRTIHGPKNQIARTLRTITGMIPRDLSTAMGMVGLRAKNVVITTRRFRPTWSKLATAPTISTMAP